MVYHSFLIFDVFSIVAMGENVCCIYNVRRILVLCHIGKDDRPLPPSFRRRNPIFVLPLQRNGRHPVTIEPGLTVHKYYNTDFFSDLATKMTDFVKFTLAATGGLSLLQLIVLFLG